MEDLVTLKPAAAHLVVRDPVTRVPLAAAGEPKPLSTYWSRRLVDGDVVVVATAANPKQPAAKAALKAVQGSTQ